MCLCDCNEIVISRTIIISKQVPWLYIPQCLNHGYILLSLNRFEIILAFYYLNILIGINNINPKNTGIGGDIADTG